jgi:GntR family transcriptional regulator
MLIALDPADQRPIYLQIVAQVKDQLRAGLLKPGEELPSVRELSESLGVNLHTVHHAYQKLREQNVIILRLGQRARIAPPREIPAPRHEVDAALSGRLREIIAEAHQLGLSQKDFLELVEEQLASQKKGAKR